MEPSAPITLRPFHETDRNGLIGLWQSCGLVVPANDPNRDINLKLTVDPTGLVVAVAATADGPQPVGSVMFGYEGHRGWINYLAVAPTHRLSGLGRRLMDHAETVLRARGCPKINLQVRTSNTGVIGFYGSLGFSQDPVTSLGKRL